MTLDEYYSLVPAFQKRVEDKDPTVWKDIDKARKEIIWPEQEVTIYGDYWNTLTEKYEVYEKKITASTYDEFYKNMEYFYEEKMPGELAFGAKIIIEHPKKVKNV